MLGSCVGTTWKGGGKCRGQCGDEAYTSVEFGRRKDENALWVDGHVTAFPELERLLADASYG